MSRDPHRESPEGASAPPAEPYNHERENRFFRRFAEAILAHRALAVLAIVGLTGLFAWAGRDIVIDNSVEAFLSSESEARDVLEQLRDDFGRDDAFLVIVEGDVFSNDYIRRLKALEAEIEKLDLDIPSLGQRFRDRHLAAAPAPAPAPAEPAPAPAPDAPAPAATDDDAFDFEDTAGGDDGFDFEDGAAPAADAWAGIEGGSIVRDVISIASVRDTRWEDGGLRVAGLFEGDQDADAIAAARAKVLANRTLLGQVVGPGARHSVMAVRTDFMSEADSARVHFALVDLVKRHEAPGFSIRIAGTPALGAELNATMLRDLGVMFALAIAFIIFIMAWQFRHPLGVLGPLVIVVLALGWTFGLMALVGVPMTMVTNILPAFIICASIGDSVHVMSVYRDARLHGRDNRDAIAHAVAVTGMPVAFTTLTTFAGLISFRGATLGAIRDMGTFGAMGVLFALVLSLVVIPIVLSFNKKSLLGHREGRTHDRISRFLGFCGGLSSPAGGSRARPAIVTAAALGLLLVSVWGGSMVRLYHDPVTWLPEDAQARTAIEDVNAHIGGTSNIALLVRAKEGETLRTRDALAAMERLEGHIRAFEHPDYGGGIVGNATSLVDVVKESWRAFHEMDEAFYRLPDDDRGVADMLTVFESRGPEELKRLVTVDFRTALMTIRVRQLDAWAYKPLTEHIEAGIASIMGDRFDVQVTGTVFNLFSVVSQLLQNLLVSFGLAFVVITVLMFLVLRDLRLGLIAMVPNLFPIANVIAVMGFFGIPIDVGTLLIASIALGIAVDDTIHFFFHYREAWLDSRDVEEGLRHAFAHSGRAMVSTSLILVGGFLVYTSATMVNLQRFGTLIALSVLFALAYDLVVAPALLRLLHRPRAASGASSKEGPDEAPAAPLPA